MDTAKGYLDLEVDSRDEYINNIEEQKEELRNQYQNKLDTMREIISGGLNIV